MSPIPNSRLADGPPELPHDDAYAVCWMQAAVADVVTMMLRYIGVSLMRDI